jgi:radical SAM superfamily enzyme YgiQ (UPF0313 family)
MKNILLIKPNSTGDKKDNYIVFPIGIGYIAAVLKQHSYNVSVIDLTIEDVDYDELKQRILDLKPDIIGLTAISHSYRQVKSLALYLRSFLSCPIILGGHLSTYSYKIVLEKTAVDICVLGEGERTIVDLLANLDNLRAVNGIAFKENGAVVLNQPRALIQNLDEIPIPAYELFNIDAYTPLTDVYLPKQKGLFRKMSLEAGRGCPFSCHFCSRTFKTVRKRSVQSLLKEMVFLNETYGIDTFWFQDELLFSTKRFMSEFCEEVKKAGFFWYGNARIDSVDEEVILKAKQSNCLEIAYGVESGSKTILKNMNKKISPEQIERILTATIKAGLHMDMGLILGYPGETADTIQETVDMFKRIGYPGLKFRYITPYPGSQLYDISLAKGLIKDEEEYMLSLSDGSGPYRLRINFTDFPDERMREIVKETRDRVFRNYCIYLLKHPSKLITRVCKKSVMNPLFVIYNRMKRSTNYDKVGKKK